MRYAIGFVVILLAIDPATAQAFVGRWYLSSPVVCKGPRGETDGLLVYTATTFYGLENICRIMSTKPKGGGVEMKLRCRGEGETSNEVELVTVKGTRLTRTVTDGGKKQSFSYMRCR